MLVACKQTEIGRMIAREIDDTGASIPHEMQIRELVQNSVESILRRISSGIKVDEIPKVAIYIKPVKLEEYDVEKFCIVNHGEDLTREIIQDNLLNYRNSGNLSVSFDQNKGIGWKVVCLPRNSEGVRFYYWDNGECYYFTISKNDNGEYETESFYDEEEDEYEEFFKAEDEDVKTIFGKHKLGTAVILFGNSPEENTYQTMHEKCSINGTADKSYGRSILKNINSRYYDSPLPDGFTIGVYQCYDKARSQFLMANCLSQEVIKGFSDKQFTFPVSFGDLTGTVEIYSKNSKNKSENKTQNTMFESQGFFGIEYGREVYHNIKKGVRSRKSINRKCGIVNDPSDFCIIVRFPMDSSLRVNPERTFLNHSDGPLDLEGLYSAICDARPQELLDYLEERVDSSFEDIQDRARSYLKSLNINLPKPESSNMEGDDVEARERRGGETDDKEGRTPRTPKRRRGNRTKSIHSKFKGQEPPKINLIEVEDDDKAETVQFIPNAYVLNIHKNCFHLEHLIANWQRKGKEDSQIKKFLIDSCYKIAFNAIEWMHTSINSQKRVKKTSSEIERYLEENIKYGCDLRANDLVEIEKKK